MSETISFINASAKRLHTYLEKVEKNDKKRLINLCETRWVEKHEAVLRFCDHYEDILSVSNSQLRVKHSVVTKLKK